MAKTDPQFRLRIPAGLGDVLKSTAKANGRSLNAEIVHRLQFSAVAPSFAPPTEDGGARAAEGFERDMASTEFPGAFVAASRRLWGDGPGKSEPPSLTSSMSDIEVADIDDWAAKYGIPSRDEAVRRLCQIGILEDREIDLRAVAAPERPDTLADLVAVVREARELFGKAYGQRVWGFLGLPEPPAPNLGATRPPDDTDTELVKHVKAFAAECVIVEPEAVCQSAALYAAYQRWARGKPFSLINKNMFGRAFAKVGHRKSKSGTTIYLDIRLASSPPDGDRLL